MNKKDKRYRKTENKIDQTFQSTIQENPQTICLRPANFIRRAKISPSTFYRHHKNLDAALSHYDKKIFKKYYRHFHLIQKFHPNLKFNITTFLKFINENQEYFNIVFTRHNSEALFKMFELLKPQIYQVYNIPNNTPKTFKMLYFEVYSLLENWQKTNFDLSELDILQKDIFALFQTIIKRIPPSEC